MYSIIIERRLRDCVGPPWFNVIVFNECQHGFRPGRGTSDLIFAVKMVLEKSWEYNSDKYTLFVDFEKNIDRVDRNLL